MCNLCGDQKGLCEDEAQCTQYKPQKEYYCKQNWTKTACPKMCGLCAGCSESTSGSHGDKKKAWLLGFKDMLPETYNLKQFEMQSKKGTFYVQLNVSGFSDYEVCNVFSDMSGQGNNHSFEFDINFRKDLVTELEIRDENTGDNPINIKVTLTDAGFHTNGTGEKKDGKWTLSEFGIKYRFGGFEMDVSGNEGFKQVVNRMGETLNQIGEKAIEAAQEGRVFREAQEKLVVALMNLPEPADGKARNYAEVKRGAETGLTTFVQGFIPEFKTGVFAELQRLHREKQEQDQNQEQEVQ